MAEKELQTNVSGVNIIGRTLPGYSERVEKWDFMRASYIGGKGYIQDHLFKYYIEGTKEYADRVARAHRENHCKRIVGLFNSYLFQEKPTRTTKDTKLVAFHENIDGKGRTIDRFMSSASLWSSIYGRVYIMVDKPSLPKSEVTGTAADNINPKAQPYCYLIHPQDIKDIAFNDDGSVKWVIIVEHVRNDADPFDSDGDIVDRYRLWTTDSWYLFNDKGDLITDANGERQTGQHGLGMVPLVTLNSEEADSYDGQSLIGDIAYMDRSIFNNWSRLDAIVCDQTFSQLIFPIEGLVTDVLNNEQLREQFMTLATNRILLYSTQAQSPPTYISPDASQAQFILTMIESQTRQLYSSLGLKSEVGTETTSESGVSKAWDFDKLNKMLADKADNLEEAENAINAIYGKWTTGEAECITDYPEKFDTRSLADEITIAQQLALMRISETFTKEIEKLLVSKALPKAKEETITVINSEIDAKSMTDEEASSGNVFDFDNKQGASSGKKASLDSKQNVSG